MLTTCFTWAHVHIHYKTDGHWVSWGELMPNCPEMKTFQKFSDQKWIAIPMMRRRHVRFLWPLRITAIGGKSECTVLWYGRDLWSGTAHKNKKRHLMGFHNQYTVITTACVASVFVKMQKNFYYFFSFCSSVRALTRAETLATKQTTDTDLFIWSRAFCLLEEHSFVPSHWSRPHTLNFNYY